MIKKLTKNEQKDTEKIKFIFGPTWHPDEGIVKFSARYLQRRTGIDSWQKKRNVDRILDAGCGIGRHVIFFSEQGFDVYGIDISDDAIKIANEWLSRKRLKSNLKVGNLTSLKFPDEYFDVIISYAVLDHMTLSDFKRSLNEIRRVLTKNGYIFLTLRSTDDSEFGRGRKIEHNTFLLREGYAKGTIQHYFNLKEIKEALVGFKIFELELHEEKFPNVFSIDKAFLQSSSEHKKNIDLSKPVKLTLKYSRWYIGAEKV